MVTLEKTGSLFVERTTEISRWTRLASSSGFSFVAAGSVLPPTKLGSRACFLGGRPGKRGEYQTEPRNRKPAERGTRKTQPSPKDPTRFFSQTSKTNTPT